MQKFIKLKELAANTVGEDNEIFSLQLQSLLNLYNQNANEVNKLEEQIISLINDIQPKSMIVPGIDPLSAAVIYAEYGDINKFNSPSAMLSFADLNRLLPIRDLRTRWAYGKTWIFKSSLYTYESLYSINSVQYGIC